MHIYFLPTINANFSRKCDTPLGNFPSKRGPAEITTKFDHHQYILRTEISHSPPTVQKSPKSFSEAIYVREEMTVHRI